MEADAKQIMDCWISIEELNSSLSLVSEVLNLAGNKVRLQILFLLQREKRRCVCDLSDILEMHVSAISQHLRKLRDRDLIYATKEANTIVKYDETKVDLKKIKTAIDLYRNIVTVGSDMTNIILQG